MDIQKEFQDLNLDESDQIIKDLETRLKQIKKTEKSVVNKPVLIAGENNLDLDDEKISENIKDNTESSEVDELETVEEMEREETALEKFRPFILPICLTLFAIIFAALFLYFFSKSKIDNSVKAITNSGTTEIIKYVEQPIVKQDPIIIPEPLTCEDPQILNEKADECVDPPKAPEPKKAGFENGTTTIVNVRFSFDKFNYDNYPRGIFLNSEQLFDGDYENFKIIPSNRPFANDYFFGIDRYMVSLLGACSYVVDDAQILVSNMRDSEGDQVYSAIKDRYFRGKVVKIIDSTKPHIVCGK